MRRRRGIEDDRSLSIQLTAKGKKLKNKALKVNQCITEACNMSDKEILALKEQLVKLREFIS